MFRKLLIANRGEIACRVIRTARDMGVATVAVYSDVDAYAPHVALADEAVAIGPAPAHESYLVADHILNAAKQTDAEAIHPGYGFLSENADFADAVRSAGLIFVGPPAQAIRDMGSKDNAKAIMENAGVPVTPGYYGSNQTEATLRKAAADIGYPVLLKAVMGGGGKGIRAVDSPDDFSDALSSAIRESKAAFGDGRMLLEKLIQQPRHVEVQVFADSYGNAVHLFERDCSLQRRHQKVIEEAPAPGMSDALRARMGDAAVAATKAVAYENAGTIEFLLDADEDFYFMEMNTRLQVEHPVTELITGQDLVAWQLRIAAGEALPLNQEALSIKGHAMEARLYAEDPVKGFLPAPGPLRHLVFPSESRLVRIDTGVVEGQEVTADYDPMIAKVITWGEDREAARRNLIGALGDTEVAGTAVNRDFLIALADLPEFVDGKPHTNLIDRLPDDFINVATPLSTAALSLAGLHVMATRQADAQSRVSRFGDPASPWHRTDGWHLNDGSHQDIRMQHDEKERSLHVHEDDNGWHFSDGEVHWLVSQAKRDGNHWTADVNGVRVSGSAVEAVTGQLNIFQGTHAWRLTLVNALSGSGDTDGGSPAFMTPMPGKIVAVNVTDGASVRAGDVLVVLEAMKMEHAIKAPVDGTVSAVHYGVGDQVDEGVDLIDFEGM